jgi:site-specific recombinase XerD
MFKVRRTAVGAIMRLWSQTMTATSLSRFAGIWDTFQPADIRPNTVSAYAYDLVHLWNFLLEKSWAWQSLSAGQAVELLIYLRSTASKRKGSGNSIRLASDRGMCIPERLSPASVNRILVAVSSFYDWTILTGALRGTGVHLVSKLPAPWLAAVPDHDASRRRVRLKFP